jgi:hypothetical protein
MKDRYIKAAGVPVVKRSSEWEHKVVKPGPITLRSSGAQMNVDERVDLAAETARSNNKIGLLDR